MSGTEQMCDPVINKHRRDEFCSNILFALLVCIGTTVKGRPGLADDIGSECQECRCVNASVTHGPLTHCPANKAEGQSQEGGGALVGRVAQALWRNTNDTIKGE